jgi:hypothetical protein
MDQRELTTGTFTATLKDGEGNTITSGVTKLEMSLYDANGTVINSVEDINILNTGRGTLTSGVLVIAFEPEDHTISGASDGRHLLKIYYEWDGGNKQAYDNTYFTVENLEQVP